MNSTRLPNNLYTDEAWAQLIAWMQARGLRLRVLKTEIIIERKGSS